MKVNLSGRRIACIAGAACFALSLLFASCAGSSAIRSLKDNVNAQQPLTYNLQRQPESESVRLLIQIPTGKRVAVKLYDIDGLVLESFWSGKQEATIDRTYNFENANEGVYRFEIFDGEKTTTRKVQLQREDIKTITRLTIE